MTLSMSSDDSRYNSYYDFFLMTYDDLFWYTTFYELVCWPVMTCDDILLFYNLLWSHMMTCFGIPLCMTLCDDEWWVVMIHLVLWFVWWPMLTCYDLPLCVDLLWWFLRIYCDIPLVMKYCDDLLRLLLIYHLLRLAMMTYDDLFI